MFLSSPADFAFAIPFLCLRRGVSSVLKINELNKTFSLPTQRCFSLSTIPHGDPCLFSAYAEVFPPSKHHRRLILPFLCLRRGVSVYLYQERGARHFSLPTQRCFLRRTGRPRFRRLFSAYAEVFPNPSGLFSQPHAFLCLRRGVSEKEARLYRYRNFSLPTQRCFQRIGVEVRVICLFSAYAEVFPTHTDQRHADRSFSLPTQRCFSDSAASCFRRHLFSAYAVVFLG